MKKFTFLQKQKIATKHFLCKTKMSYKVREEWSENYSAEVLISANSRHSLGWLFTLIHRVWKLVTVKVVLRSLFAVTRFLPWNRSFSRRKTFHYTIGLSSLWKFKFVSRDELKKLFTITKMFVWNSKEEINRKTYNSS